MLLLESGFRPRKIRAFFDERKILLRASENRSKSNETAQRASDQAVIGVSFQSDWLRDWHEFPVPITEPSKIEAFLVYFRRSMANCFVIQS